MEMDKTDHVKDNELYQAFKVFDTDSDGFVTLEEFTKAMKVCLCFDLMHTLDFKSENLLRLWSWRRKLTRWKIFSESLMAITMTK